MFPFMDISIKRSAEIKRILYAENRLAGNLFSLHMTGLVPSLHSILNRIKAFGSLVV